MLVLRFSRSCSLFAILALACWSLLGTCAPTFAQDAAEKAAATKEVDAAHADAPHDAAHTDEHAHHEHVGEKGVTEDQKSPAQWRNDLALWSFVVFLILMAILTKFAWKPIGEALDKREAGINANIAKAQGAAAEARAMLGEYEKKLAGAADQVRAMLEEARRDAEVTKAQILEEAKNAAQAEHDRAIRDIRSATDGALKELAEQSATLATDLAGKMLSAKMNKEDHASLIKDALGKFLTTGPSKN